ncbi:MAG TPA: FGGY-family carbohydrate kinase, partial [Microbacteriaceae bacterium]|nr:FGGY-family carbohydrate kinase [Microbacteriaceae bacterium]
DEAAKIGGRIPVFDVNDPRFLPPGSRPGDPGGDMPTRIARWLREHDEQVPDSPAGFARSIIESLATAFARTMGEVGELTGERVRVIHLVGGGSQSALLCQRTAELSGLPVVAGPAEATAIGNVLVQARALGAFRSSSPSASGSGAVASLEELRRLVARTTRPIRYEPAA